MIKSIKFYVPFILFIIMISSCNQVIDYDKDGDYFKNDNGIYYFKGSLINGTVESHYENGKLKFIWSIKDGKMDGEQIEYYKNGQIEEILNYNEGKLLTRKAFLDSGKLLFDKKYNN
jgi:antitoxin component YwqK of YwqJK toxin-antitoxin module